MIDIITDVRSFEQLKKEWERIECNPELRIFQTYVWCRTAWDSCVSKENGVRLWILYWHQEGKDDTVIFPFYIDRQRRLRIIMDTHSDICDSVHGPSNINRHWAYKEAAEIIRCEKSISSVFLQKMDGRSELLNYFSVLLPGCVVSRDNAFSWLVAEQSDSFIAGQKQFRRKDRDRLKAIARKKDGFDFKILSLSNGDTFPEGYVVDLRKTMIGWRRRDASFLTDHMINFIKEIYISGKCEIPVLVKDGCVSALAFRLLKGNWISYWIVLYKEQRLTTELYLAYMMQKTQECGCVFDFGVGTYGYKLGVFRPKLGATFSLRYARNLFCHLLCLINANVRLLKDLFKPRLCK